MTTQAGSDSADLVRSGEHLSKFFDVDTTAATLRVSDEASASRQGEQSYPIRLVPVHTFILQGHSKDVPLSKGILVPSFASHWGVVVGVPDAFTLYHLVFRFDVNLPNDTINDSIKGKNKVVRFHHAPWENKHES